MPYKSKINSIYIIIIIIILLIYIIIILNKSNTSLLSFLNIKNKNNFLENYNDIFININIYIPKNQNTEISCKFISDNFLLLGSIKYTNLIINDNDYEIITEYLIQNLNEEGLKKKIVICNEKEYRDALKGTFQIIDGNFFAKKKEKLGINKNNNFYITLSNFLLCMKKITNKNIAYFYDSENKLLNTTNIKKINKIVLPYFNIYNLKFENKYIFPVSPGAKYIPYKPNMLKCQ